MNKLVLVGVLLGTLGSAAADAGFVGWSKDNTWWAARTADDKVMFCPSVNAGPPTWGNLPEPESNAFGPDCLWEGELGADGSTEFRPPPGWESKIVPATPLARLPAGVTLKVDTRDADSPSVTIKLGKLKTTCATGGRKLLASYLRGDGQTLVLHYNVYPTECDIKLFNLQADGGPPAGDRKAATAVTKLAMKAYKAHLWSDASAGFRQAIALDPGWSNAHYNLASVAAIVGDLATTRSELGWMAKAGDAEAVRLLAKAQKDPDLDAASTDPEVRRLIGLGDYSDLLTEQIATERSGVWSHEGSDCEMPFMLLTFKKNGTLTLKLTLECEGKKLSETLKGKWRDDEGVLQLSGGKSKDGKFSLDGTPVNPIKCKGSSVAGSCLAIAGSEDLAFHRGQPEISMGFKY